MMIDHNFNNFNNYSLNPFDFSSDRNDFLDNGINLGTNQMSTNFFSKFMKNGEDKI